MIAREIVACNPCIRKAGGGLMARDCQPYAQGRGRPNVSEYPSQITASYLKAKFSA